MDILVAVLLGTQQAIFGVLAIVVSLKHKVRVRYAIVFGVLSIIGIALIVWQAMLAHCLPIGVTTKAKKPSWRFGTPTIRFNSKFA